MQRGKINHILLGSPVTTFLVVAQSVHHHNFPVSLSLPGEGTPSRAPAAALGTAGDRDQISCAQPELRPPAVPRAHPCSRQSCLTANGGRGTALLLQGEAPARPRACLSSFTRCTTAAAWSPVTGGGGFAGAAARGLPEAAALDLPELRRAPSSLSRARLGAQEWPWQRAGR